MAVLRLLPRALAAAAAALALASALPAAPPAAARTAEPAALRAAGSWIVTLRAELQSDASVGSQAAARASRDLVDRYGGTVGHVYGAALNGFSIRLGSAQAQRLAADPAVRAVHPDGVVRISAAQTAPPSWGLDRIDQPSLPLDSVYHYPDSAGAGVTAYVLDTGVRISHRDFGGRASYGHDFVDGDATAEDGNGHGTHVAGTLAGTAYGVAKKAAIVAVRVLDDTGAGTISDAIAGIDWVTAHARRPAVANLSLGGEASAELDAALRNSIAAGITYAVAAGNDGADASGSSPARVPEALTVGATTRSDARADYSDYGPVVDLFAPGSGITSDWPTDDTATRTLSGTSMAAPHVAGAAALYLATHTGAGPAEVAGALTRAAAGGKLSEVGSGSPNLLLQITG
ncbi:S8 family peptidase [Peterkaempfera bronchialis]|uniref:S8 family peptidase n=1 Tax=Peterkaempfera bronchialis TaxID=2126346 RepID=A0A345SWP4_9ACTN|nr:S8 family peptidase [Peterkaempfera bronchialis]AXI78149.1 S8 family peptidase [Peterkaempfera bronchialis]